MKSIKVAKGQTLLDVAIQEYGNVEDIVLIAADNDLLLTDRLTEGQALSIRTDYTSSPAKQKYLQTNGVRPATDIAGANDVSATIAAPDCYAGDNNTAVATITNNSASVAILTATLSWNNDDITVPINELLFAGETKIINSTVVAPDLWLGNRIVELKNGIVASDTFKVKGKATYAQSNCLQCVAGQTYIKLHSNVQINESTITKQGTATFIRHATELNKLISTVSGTLYNLQFEDTGAIQYQFPLSEGGDLRIAHCVKTKTRADVPPTWTKQDVFHWNLKYGATRLVNTQTSQVAFIPYDITKVKVFNDAAVDNTDYAAWSWTFTP